jgi:membrane protease YdiL (CAAX protease family)
LVSSLIIGIIWTVWHAPAGIIEIGFIGWALDLPMYMISVIGISVVATWLYNNSEGSVLLTMLFHAGINGAQALYPVRELFTTTGELARTISWLLVLAFCGWLMRRQPSSKETRSRSRLETARLGETR